MGYDKQEIKFGGLAYRIAETEFAGSFADDEDDALADALWREYREEGRPANPEAWLRSRLADLFTWVDDPPRWLEANPRWPFHNGRPMVFIKQYDIPGKPLVEARLAPDVVIYVFGARTPILEYEGWETCYRVVENHKSLAGI